MHESRISRRWVLGSGAVGAIGVLLAPEAALAQAKAGGRVDLLRWDLVQIISGVVLAGGTDVTRNAPTGDTLSFTGSGQANPHRRTAAGGGTFVHLRPDGSEVGRGIYYVTGFNSWVNGAGSLVGSGLIDGIGELNRTTGGVLSLMARAVSPDLNADGIFEIFCQLPGGEHVTEGVRLSVPQFNNLVFAQAGGSTLFHVLDN